MSGVGVGVYPAQFISDRLHFLSAVSSLFTFLHTQTLMLLLQQTVKRRTRSLTLIISDDSHRACPHYTEAAARSVTSAKTVQCKTDTVGTTAKSKTEEGRRDWPEKDERCD